MIKQNPKKKLARAIVKDKWGSYFESLKYFSSEKEAAEFLVVIIK